VAENASISSSWSSGTRLAGEPRMLHLPNPQQTPNVVSFPEVGSRPKRLDRVR